jgi:hypothetical protein
LEINQLLMLARLKTGIPWLADLFICYDPMVEGATQGPQNAIWKRVGALG